MADTDDLVFRTVSNGSGDGRDDDVAPRVFLVRDESGWPEVVCVRSYRVSTDGSVSAVVSRPDVDLSQETVVVVSLGMRPSTGYDLDIDRLSVHDGILVIEATETLPGPAVDDMATYPVQVVAVRPSDLVGDKMRLQLRVVLPAPPGPGPSWAGCYVLVEGRQVGEVGALLATSALPSDAQREVSSIKHGAWALITDPGLGLADADDELRRWSSAGRVVRFTVLEPQVRSRATLWDAGNVIWDVSYEADANLRLVVVGDLPFDLDTWADEIAVPYTHHVWFLAAHEAVDRVTDWLPPLSKPVTNKVGI